MPKVRSRDVIKHNKKMCMAPRPPKKPNPKEDKGGTKKA